MCGTYNGLCVGCAGLQKISSLRQYSKQSNEILSRIECTDLPRFPQYMEILDGFLVSSDGLTRTD